MHSRRLGIFLALMVTLVLPTVSHAYESKLVAEYLKAVDARDAAGQAAIIKENMGRIPSEVKALLYEAAMQKTSGEDKEANYFIAEQIAKSVFDITGDSALLIEVKQTVFNSKLSSQVSSTLQGGVHIVEFPKAGADHKNVFKPNNIKISAGQTVRWVNRDEIAHIFASMPVIGKGGIFTPDIEPGKHWEFKFETPGDYYYICFIHKGMIGKITVAGVAGGGATGAVEKKREAEPTQSTSQASSASASSVEEKSPEQSSVMSTPEKPKKKKRRSAPEQEEDPFDDM